ncbi:MAG: GxxExxY protein [Chloroflexota bacterium]|nr:GxxExxY protein [Chloroflexota bacterium]
MSVNLQEQTRRLLEEPLLGGQDLDEKVRRLLKNENQISRVVLGSAIEVHRTVGGPGLLESVYEEALAWDTE